MKRPVFTQWYANGKDAMVCGREYSNVDNDDFISCFGKYSQDRSKGWIQCPALCQQ